MTRFIYIKERLTCGDARFPLRGFQRELHNGISIGKSNLTNFLISKGLKTVSLHRIKGKDVKNRGAKLVTFD